MDSLAPPTHPRAHWPVLAAFVLFALVYGAGMGRSGYEGKDERRYSQVAKEIGPGRDFLVMRYMGELYPDKPPVFFWMEALSFKVFGLQPLAPRVPLFLTSLLALFFAYLIMRRLEGERIALIGVVLLALSFRFFWAGRWVRLDMPMCAFTFGSFWVSARLLFPREGERPASAWFPLWGWVFAALAILTKGPGVIPWMITLVAFAIITRDRTVITKHRFAIGIPLMLAIVAAWFVPAAILGGKDYYGPMIGTHVVERLAGAVRHEKPFWYFFPKLLSDSMPAGLFLPAAIWWAWKGSGGVKGAGDSTARRSAIFLLCWLGFGLIFFSIPSGKRGQYILPLYPAVACLVARFVSAAIADLGAARKIFMPHFYLLTAAATMLGIAALFWTKPLTDDFQAAPTLALRLCLFAGFGIAGGAAILWALKRRFDIALASAALGLSLGYASLFVFYFPANRDDALPRAVGRFLNDASFAEKPVVFHGADDQFAMYLRAVPREISKPEQVAAFIQRHPDAQLLVTKKKYAKLASTLGEPQWNLIETWKLPEEKTELLLFSVSGAPAIASHPAE